MQLIPNGPDIPSALLQAHEEGRVVFFCGAGIACSAGLPLFKGLVDKIYQKLHTSYSEQGHELEKTAYCASSFDRVLQLLEQRYPGGKNEARKVLPEILATPNPTELALANHKALLTLAADSTNKVKLVTTNYDHLFAQAAEKLDKTHNYYSAPLLPLPKQNIWNGVVYLHGLLPFSANKSATQNHTNLSLSNLVLTSGDFGAAYLTERWAARFVTELFKKYVLCFIGYSLDDPILRYMVDALAADSEQGELEYQAYAFASCGEADRQSIKNSWRAKGVEPILYSSVNNHGLLKDTLTQWASNYELGADTHKQVVSSYANAIPSKSTKEDDYVSRVLWAVSDASAEGAKAFAEYQPVPPFDWFDVFTEKRYEHADLLRFQVSDYPKTLTNDQPLKFSLLHRPTPSKQTSWLSPLTDNAELQLDTVTYQLCRWMVRHLDQPKLLLVVAKHGGKVHETFKQLIQDELDAIHQSADSDQTIAESFKQSVLLYPDLQLKIIGDGPEKATVEQRIKALSLDRNVQLLGKISDSAVKKEFFSKAYCVISPLQAGLSVVESFSYGVPFVTSTTAITGGESQSINHDVNGVLLENVSELSDVICSFIDGRRSSSLLGSNAYQFYVENLAFNLYVKRFKNFIKQHLEN